MEFRASDGKEGLRAVEQSLRPNENNLEGNKRNLRRKVREILIHPCVSFPSRMPGAHLPAQLDRGQII